jgi:hypothetical protein
MRKKTKKRYTKPQVTKIKLETKEAVLGICKAEHPAFSGTGFCYNASNPGCYSIGS